MAPDDLNTPLGQNQRKKARKFPIAGPQLLAGLLGLCGIVVVGWAALVNDPLGGEPVAIVATRAPVAAAKQSGEGGDGAQHARYDGPSAVASAIAPGAEKNAPPPAGAKTVTIIDGSNGKRHDVIIPGKAGDAAQAKTAVDPKLVETTRQGALPKIGPDGTRVAAAYAHPRDVPADRKDLPRIAIVIGGLGISASSTADALSTLPAPVTFALAPYGDDLEKLAERVRAENHEVLLQVPMEPFDYPDNDPGPQTLLTSLTPEQNIERLHWLMSRFQGYVGLLSYMGARFTASEQALTPVLNEAAQRGLIYVDDGASMRSVAAQIAGSHSLPFAKTDIVLDAVPTPVEIGRALTRLEMAAHNNGTAVGFASAQPAAIARIAEWAKTVEGRGFVLVPISMIASKAKSS